MKKGLIIQGPLYSPGYGPYEFQPDGTFQKLWINFDSKINVLETIELAEGLFDHIVVATWQNDDYIDFIKSLEGYSRVRVIELREDMRLLELRQKGVHKYHQVKTLGAGAGILEELGCDVVAKIRTDHSVNLKLLSQDVELHRRRNDRSLGVPNINLFELDRLTDFYFVGRSNVIREMCEYYSNNPETCADTHRDYFLNFLQCLSRDKNLIKCIQDADNSYKRDFHSIAAWTNYFYPLRPAMFKNFYWRGRTINHRLNGWIRWFHSFHKHDTTSHNLKFVLNLILILTIRELKRPTIRFSSAMLFRLYRRKALRSFASSSKFS